MAVNTMNGINAWFSKLSFVAHSTSRVERDLFTEDLSTVDFRFQKLDQRLADSSLNKGIIPPPKDLFRLCRNGDWNVFILKCQEYPHLLNWVGPYRQNLLHFICTRRPSIEAIQLFIQYCPETLLKEDKDSCLPIHMAMTNGASHEVICTLISKAPVTIFHSNKWGYHPFDWIWRRCKYELIHVDNLDDINEERFIWNTVHVLVQAASYYSGSLQNGNILHMTMDFKCPLDLVKLILAKWPKMGIEKDCLGRIPLARAVSSHTRPSIELINILLEEDPKIALTRDGYGRVPFHLAIINGIHWNKGLQQVFHAAPIAISMDEPLTSLFPFQLIACNTHEGENAFTLTDIFILVSRCPSLVKKCKKTNNI